jgi:hypothetical protein
MYGMGCGPLILLGVVMVWVGIVTEGSWRDELPILPAAFLYLALILGWAKATRMPREEQPTMVARIPLGVAMVAGGISGCAYGLMRSSMVSWYYVIMGGVLAVMNRLMQRLSLKYLDPKLR